MSKIKNGGLDQYGAEPFERQQFGTAGVEGVKRSRGERVNGCCLYQDEEVVQLRSQLDKCTTRRDACNKPSMFAVCDRMRSSSSYTVSWTNIVRWRPWRSRLRAVPSCCRVRESSGRTASRPSPVLWRPWAISFPGPPPDASWCAPTRTPRNSSLPKCLAIGTRKLRREWVCMLYTVTQGSDTWARTQKNPVGFFGVNPPLKTRLKNREKKPGPKQ